MKGLPKIVPKKRQLKVFLPSNLEPSLFLTNSDRFKAYNLGDIEKLRAFIYGCFNVDFELKHIGDIIDVVAPDLDQSDFVAFLPIGEKTLGFEVGKCIELGIPVIFIRHDPQMECEVVNIEQKENECFKNRPSCNGQRGKHCSGNFSASLDFGDTATIPKIKKFFHLEQIPIFSMSFIIDFLIWYGNFGMTLRENRDNRIKTEAKTEAQQAQLILSAIKGLSYELGEKVS